MIGKMLPWTAVVVLALASAGQSAEKAPTPRENIEWCDIWIPNANVGALPRVLLVGDSITMGYFSRVEKQLAGQAYCARLATSRSVGDPVLLAELKLVLDQYPFDVVHFNNGLHGWRFTEDEYRRRFPDLLSTLRKHAPRAKLVWATTTPVRTAGKLEQFEARTERVRTRNRIAQEYVTRARIPVNDLFALVEAHPEFYSADGVHFNGEGATAQAAQVARSIQQQLGEPSPRQSGRAPAD